MRSAITSCGTKFNPMIFNESSRASLRAITVLQGFSGGLHGLWARFGHTLLSQAVQGSLMYLMLVRGAVLKLSFRCDRRIRSIKSTGLNYYREQIATYDRVRLDELLREQRATERTGRDEVPNDRLRLSMGRWQLMGQRLSRPIAARRGRQ